MEARWRGPATRRANKRNDTMTADLLPLDDCPKCHGTGTYREYRGESWGMPAWEWVLCPCMDMEKEEEDES